MRYRGLLRYLMLLLGILLFFGGAGCFVKSSTARSDRTRLRYQIPADYRGYVFIRFGVADAAPLLRSNGEYIVSVPASGVVKTSTVLPVAPGKETLEEQYQFFQSGYQAVSSLPYLSAKDVEAALTSYSNRSADMDPGPQHWPARARKYFRSVRVFFVGDPNLANKHMEATALDLVPVAPQYKGVYPIYYKVITKQQVFSWAVDFSSSRYIVKVGTWRFINSRGSRGDFSNSRAQHGEFKNVLLVHSKLRDCDFHRMHWDSVFLFNTDLSGTRFDNMRFEDCFYDEATRWPAGFSPTANGWISLRPYKNRDRLVKLYLSLQATYTSQNDSE